MSCISTAQTICPFSSITTSLSTTEFNAQIISNSELVANITQLGCQGPIESIQYPQTMSCYKSSISSNCSQVVPICPETCTAYQFSLQTFFTSSKCSQTVSSEITNARWAMVTAVTTLCGLDKNRGQVDGCISGSTFESQNCGLGNTGFGVIKAEAWCISRPFDPCCKSTLQVVDESTAVDPATPSPSPTPASSSNTSSISAGNLSLIVLICLIALAVFVVAGSIAYFLFGHRFRALGRGLGLVASSRDVYSLTLKNSEVGAERPTSTSEVGAERPTSISEVGAERPTSISEVGAERLSNILTSSNSTLSSGVSTPSSSFPNLKDIEANSPLVVSTDTPLTDPSNLTSPVPERSNVYDDIHSPDIFSGEYNTTSVVQAYSPSQADEIGLAVGDIVKVYKVYPDGWGYGSIGDTVGLFPVVCLGDDHDLRDISRTG
jgi:hypothetical protein